MLTATMTRSGSWSGLLALALLCAPVGCSSDDSSSVPADTTSGVSDGGAGDVKTTPDAPPADQAVAQKPKITKIVPASGLADGGRKGAIPVTLIGENFDADMTVYIDGGQDIITGVTYTSPVSVSFAMPKNPYGPPYDKPAKVSVSVLVKGQSSNPVDFQYTVTDPMTAERSAEVLSKSGDAYRDFPSQPIEARVFIKDLTDTTTGAPAGLTAEMGIGREGEDPTQDYSFRWFAASFVKDDGTADVFAGAVVAALSTKHDVAFRFSTDGGQHWVYADTKADDLTYAVGDAAKLTTTDPPFGYCQVGDDCLTFKHQRACHLDADWMKNLCVECDTDADCKANAAAFGPTCNTAQMLCVCASAADCVGNPNGKACVTGGSYCGCEAHEDCDAAAGEKCTQDEKTKLQTCQVTSS